MSFDFNDNSFTSEFFGESSLIHEANDYQVVPTASSYPTTVEITPSQPDNLLFEVVNLNHGSVPCDHFNYFHPNFNPYQNQLNPFDQNLHFFDKLPKSNPINDFSEVNETNIEVNYPEPEAEPINIKSEYTVSTPPLLFW